MEDPVKLRDMPYLTLILCLVATAAVAFGHPIAYVLVPLAFIAIARTITARRS